MEELSLKEKAKEILKQNTREAYIERLRQLGVIITTKKEG